MLSLNLTPIFNARGIDRPYSFLVNAGFTSHTAHCLLNSATRAIRLDHIELLCKVLVCEPSDLFSFTPGKKENLANEHPLLKLQHEDIAASWSTTLATMPFRQLKKVTQQMNNNNVE